MIVGHNEAEPGPRQKQGQHSGVPAVARVVAQYCVLPVEADEGQGIWRPPELLTILRVLLLLLCLAGEIVFVGYLA